MSNFPVEPRTPTVDVEAVHLRSLAARGAPARAQLFESDSKQLGNSKMDIVVKEVERRARGC